MNMSEQSHARQQSQSQSQLQLQSHHSSESQRHSVTATVISQRRVVLVQLLQLTSLGILVHEAPNVCTCGGDVLHGRDRGGSGGGDHCRQKERKTRKSTT